MVAFTVNLPGEFGNRTCDRLLVRRLLASGVSRSDALWMAFLVWRDFATAREDRREVPNDPALRADSPAVAILEEYVQWQGAPGGFVEACIESGFFLLTPVSEEAAEIVLVDFFPANASISTVTNSERGGVAKSYRNIAVKAEAAAADQLRLFETNGGAAVEGIGQREMREACMLVHSICLALKRPHPKQEEWRNTLITKAAAVCRSVPAPDRECVLRWMVLRRTDQRIPLRNDLVLDKFEDFLPDAIATFGQKA